MAIISLSGYAGSGKDTAGRIIQYLTIPDTKKSLDYVLAAPDKDIWLTLTSNWEIRRWADKLKQIASLLTGIPKHKFEDQEFKKTQLGPKWGMTVREFIQRLGTDAVRYGLHPNAWVNALMSDYIPYSTRGSDYECEESHWIITDTRFENEAQAIKDKGGIIIRIDRPGVTATNGHISETALDTWDFDYRVNNNDTTDALALQLARILEKEGLLNTTLV